MFFAANGSLCMFFVYVWYYIAMYGGLYIYEGNFFIRWFELFVLIAFAVANFIIAAMRSDG